MVFMNAANNKFAKDVINELRRLNSMITDLSVSMPVMRGVRTRSFRHFTQNNQSKSLHSSIIALGQSLKLSTSYFLCWRFA